MQEFGEKMKVFGNKIKESVEKSVKHLGYGSPHIHYHRSIPRSHKNQYSGKESLEDFSRELEERRNEVRAPLEKIELLKELLEEGMITQEDFDKKKQKILDEM